MLAGQVDIEKHGSFLTNRYLQTSDSDIYAAGDCCMVRFNPTGQPAYTPLASSAIRQGMLVAHNIFGHTHPYIGTQASSALELYGNTLATTGLTLQHALNSGLNAASVTYEGTWRPEYMPSLMRSPSSSSMTVMIAVSWRPITQQARDHPISKRHFGCYSKQQHH